MKNVSKKLSILLLTAIMSIFLFSTTYAVETAKMLQAWFGVKVVYNSQDISNATIKPFIVDGTTYVPLRMVIDSFNKDIKWDDATKTVTIVDKPNTTEIALRNQIIVKDATIADLQNRLNKAQADDDDDDDVDIDDLEEELNDDYEDFDSRDYEITLNGDEDEISVRIECSSSDWSNLTTSEKTKLLQDICDDIRDEYDDAEITGYVRSSSSSTKYAYFYFNSCDVVRYHSDEDVYDFEMTLDEDYNDYFEDEDIPVYVALEIDEDDDVYEFHVYVDYDEYDNDWDDLVDDDEDKIEELMSDIFDEVQDEYSLDDDEVDGYIYDYDDSEIGYYYKTSSGSVSFDVDD